MDRAISVSGKNQRTVGATRDAWRLVTPAALIILCIIMTLGFLGLAASAHTTPYFSLDLNLTRAIQGFHPAWFDLLMRGIGEPGYPPQVYVWLVVMFLVFYKTGLKWQAIMEGFASLGIGVVGLAVKIIVDRPRPSPTLIGVLNPALDGGKYSFPAGHVQVYMAIIGFLLFLSITLAHKHAWTRVVEIIGFSIFLALIGFSRVYVGEHWPSDVLGAYLLGTLWLVLTIAIYKWGEGRYFTDRRPHKSKGSS